MLTVGMLTYSKMSWLNSYIDKLFTGTLRRIFRQEPQNYWTDIDTAAAAIGSQLISKPVQP